MPRFPHRCLRALLMATHTQRAHRHGVRIIPRRSRDWAVTPGPARIAAMPFLWHRTCHARCHRSRRKDRRLVAHCALETYSVLARLPPPHRAPGDVVRDFLAARFRQPFLRLSARAYWEFLLHLPDHGVTGGASYDALVAATVASHDAELVTCDRRAAPVYERYGIRVHLL